MPFAPNLPAPGSPNASAELRMQLTGLKDLIDALEAGQVTGAVIDSIATVPPADPASCSVTFSAGVLHFSFSIPRGFDGPPGEVSNATMNEAIGIAITGTSANSNAIPTLDSPFADPDAEALRGAYNALVLALRR